MAHMGIGTASGEKRAVEAARQAVESPLLETTINGAKGVLLNITGGADLGLLEVNEAAELIQATADPDANIIFGAGIDDELGDSLRITVIATGFESVGHVSSPTVPVRQRLTVRDVRDPLGSAREPQIPWQPPRQPTPPVQQPPAQGKPEEEQAQRTYVPRDKHSNLDVPSFLRNKEPDM